MNTTGRAAGQARARERRAFQRPGEPLGNGPLAAFGLGSDRLAFRAIAASIDEVPAR